MNTIRIYRRTFEARKHPKGSPERKRLNLHSETSEYGGGHRYGQEILMGTGSTSRDTFRTKAEAEANTERWLKEHPEYTLI